MSDLKEGKNEWPSISREERTQHEIFFYSQGPLEGYLDEGKARDLFLKSTLPLPTLSQIWNLADVSNDNLLDVHEFVLAMHLVHGVLQGKKLPKTLPRTLTIPTIKPEKFVMTPKEKEAYTNLFNALDGGKKGFIEGFLAKDLFIHTGLPPEQLAQVWDLADVNRDGRLDPDEFNIACHLIRMIKKGEYKCGPVNIFSYLAHRLSPSCLHVRKSRVAEYEERKYQLMTLKEKRKADVTREKKRLELYQQKIKLLKDLYKKSANPPLSSDQFQAWLTEGQLEVEKQEEIAFRLQKEHEKVRQQTVKIILEEQKLNDDIRIIKKETDQLNKRLRALHTKATKETDPFHQLYEQRKEHASVVDIVSSDIYVPFVFNPFDKSALLVRETSGCVLFPSCDLFEKNHRKTIDIPEGIIVAVKDFSETFVESFSKITSRSSAMSEEDSVFKTAPVRSVEEDPLLCLSWSGHKDENSFSDLERKLVDLKNEITKLNMEGDRLIFKNPEDYSARKRSKEEEEKTDKLRHNRRKAESNEGTKRRSYHIKQDDEATRAAREYRLNRRSLHLEHKSDTKPETSPSKPSAPKRPSRFPKTSSEESPEDISNKSPILEQTTEDLNISQQNTREQQSPKRSSSSKISSERTSDHEKNSELSSPSTSPRHPSIKKIRAPPPPGRTKLKLANETSSPGETAISVDLSPDPDQSFEICGNKSIEFSLDNSVELSPEKSFQLSTDKSVELSLDNSVNNSLEKSLDLSPNKSVTNNNFETQTKKVKDEQLFTLNRETNNDQNQVQISLNTEINQGTKSIPKAPPRLKKRKESFGSTSGSEKNSPRDSVSSPVSPASSFHFKTNSTEFNQVSSTKTLISETNETLEKENSKNTSRSLPENDSKDVPVILSTSLESEVFAALQSSPLFNNTDNHRAESTVDTHNILPKIDEKPSETDLKLDENSKKSYFNNNINETKVVEESKLLKTTGHSPEKTKPNQKSENIPNKILTTNVSHKTESSSVQSSKPLKTEQVASPVKEQKLLKQQCVVEPDIDVDDEDVVTIIEETIILKHPIILPSDTDQAPQQKWSTTEKFTSREKSTFKEYPPRSKDREPVAETKSPTIMPEWKLNFLDENELKLDMASTSVTQKPTSEVQTVKTKSTKKTVAPRPPRQKEEIKLPVRAKTPDFELPKYKREEIKLPVRSKTPDIQLLKYQREEIKLPVHSKTPDTEVPKYQKEEIKSPVHVKTQDTEVPKYQREEIKRPVRSKTPDMKVSKSWKEEIKLPVRSKTPDIEVTKYQREEIKLPVRSKTPDIKVPKSQKEEIKLPLRSKTSDTEVTKSKKKVIISRMHAKTPDTVVPNVDVSVEMATPVPSVSPKEDRKYSSKTKSSASEKTKTDIFIEETMIPKWSSLPDNISIASTESGSSEPPPLPSSAPPPLPTVSRKVIAEDVNVEYSIPQHQTTKMATKLVTDFKGDYLADAESQNKTVAEMRADFFGLEKLSSSSLRKISEERTTSPPEKMDVFFNNFQSSLKQQTDDQISLPSDDDSSFTATFSPGDSGVIMSSLPTSPDNDEEGIQLVSYHSFKQTKGEDSDQTTPQRTSTSPLHTRVDLSLDLNDTVTSVNSSGYQQEPHKMMTDSQTRDEHVVYSRGSSSSPLSSPLSEGVTSPRTTVYNPEELLGKARQFADIVQKPNFVVKRESSKSDDFNQEKLQELELERRAVISQATVRKRDVPITSPSHWHEKPEDITDDIVISDPSISGHHWELTEDPLKSPDVSFQAVDKIALYSKNVIQEKDTTEEVNRESIANLETTRKQWETILTPVIEKEQTTTKITKTSGSVRHWEVKIPSKTNQAPGIQTTFASEQSNGISDMADTESAIEREIRVAMEREEMVRKEQQEREQLMKHKGKVDIGIFQSCSEDESFKPNFHEMTEADRGSEMWKRETLIQEELRAQEERERSFLKKKQQVDDDDKQSFSEEQPEPQNESIIEREIRLQREREEEIANIRHRASDVLNDVPDVVDTVNNSTYDEVDSEVQNDINHNESKDISYESAIQGYTHEGESLIAKELRELREREEELLKQREMFNKVGSVTPKKEPEVSKPQSVEKKSVSTPTMKTGTWQRDVSPFIQKQNRRESLNSLDSSQDTLKSQSDNGMSPESMSTSNSFSMEAAEETPIEREIRLARERENELRRTKGLPELPAPKSSPRDNDSSNTTCYQALPRYSASGPNTMRRFASNRLQHEIIAQKQRELDLRKEGKIITTSEEHIEPLKYVSVTGQDKSSSSVKRNFMTRRSTPGSSDRTDDETASDTSSNTSQTTGFQTPEQTARPKRKVTPGSASTTFSYKESHQTAESKIERELREMREREDELRKLHCRSHQNESDVSREGESDSARETTQNGDTETENESERVTPRRVNLAAHWEQVCNK